MSFSRFLANTQHLSHPFAISKRDADGEITTAHTHHSNEVEVATTAGHFRDGFRTQTGASLGRRVSGVVVFTGPVEVESLLRLVTTPFPPVASVLTVDPHETSTPRPVSHDGFPITGPAIDSPRGRLPTEAEPPQDFPCIVHPGPAFLHIGDIDEQMKVIGHAAPRQYFDPSHLRVDFHRPPEALLAKPIKDEAPFDGA